LPYWDFAQVAGQMPMFRCTVSTPGQIGMFPANALMFRKGLIARGNVVVHEERTLQSIFERKTPIISEENSFDPNRDSYEHDEGAGETEIAPVAYPVGEVRVAYGGNPADTYVSSELEDLLDFGNKKINSITGELIWDYNNGICVLDAPSAKGICGLPGSKESYELTDVTIKTTNDYVVINVVAMDDKPISQSEKILIQIGTTYRPTNWDEDPSSFELGGETVDGFKISNVGKMTWQAANSEVSVVINNPDIQSVRVLNMNGYESREIWVKTDDSSNLKEIMIPKNGMYIIADTRTASVLGLDEMQGKISIYPNLGNGMLEIESNGNTLVYNEVKVLDLSGKVVRKFGQKKDQYQLILPSGAYLVQLSNNDELVLSKKIVISN
jgi:hypothetical protein